MLSRPDGFMLYGKLGVDFFSVSELLYPNMKIRLRLIGARSNFYMISDVSLEIVDCSLYTRCIALKDDYHKKRMDMLAYIPVEFNFFGNSCKDFHHSCQTKPVHLRKHFQQCSSSTDCYCDEYKLCIHCILNWNSILVSTIRSQTKNKILRGGQSIVDFDAADNCPFYVTTRKTLNFQDDIPSIPIDNFKNHYVLVFDLTSMQEATENCHYPVLVGEPLRPELNFIFPLEHVTELFVLGERTSSVAVDKFGVVGENILIG